MADVNYVDCTAYLAPGVSFRRRAGISDNYDDIIWTSEEVAQPTEAECIAAWSTILAEIEAEAAQDAKRPAARERTNIADITKLIAAAESATGWSSGKLVLIGLARIVGDMAVASGYDTIINGE